MNKEAIKEILEDLKSAQIIIERCYFLLDHLEDENDAA